MLSAAHFYWCCWLPVVHFYVVVAARVSQTCLPLGAVVASRGGSPESHHCVHLDLGDFDRSSISRFGISETESRERITVPVHQDVLWNSHSVAFSSVHQDHCLLSGDDAKQPHASPTVPLRGWLPRVQSHLLWMRPTRKCCPLHFAHTLGCANGEVSIKLMSASYFVKYVDIHYHSLRAYYIHTWVVQGQTRSSTCSFTISRLSTKMEQLRTTSLFLRTTTASERHHFFYAYELVPPCSWSLYRHVFLVTVHISVADGTWVEVGHHFCSVLGHWAPMSLLSRIKKKGCCGCLGRSQELPSYGVGCWSLFVHVVVLPRPTSTTFSWHGYACSFALLLCISCPYAFGVTVIHKSWFKWV